MRRTASRPASGAGAGRSRCSPPACRSTSRTPPAGENAVARRFDALARLWELITRQPGDIELGFCFDTCHAHAAGEELDDAVERVLSIVDRIDLLHANDSRDPPGTGADRHANLGKGTMGADVLRSMIARAGGPVVCETPGDAEDMRADLAFVREALPS